MQAAVQFAPTAPVRVLPDSGVEPRQIASVTVLYAPREPAGAAPLRLTRRGVAVLTVAVLALGVGLIWLGRLSAPQGGAAPPAPRTVTVQPGDTLWSIASRVAPEGDPRAEVAALERRNHLRSVDLVPGQLLHVP